MSDIKQLSDTITQVITTVDFANFKLFEPNNKFKVFQRDTISYIYDSNTNKISDLKILSTESDNLIVSGVLEINSKITYGYDNKKRPYKLFNPLNRLFPKFLVAYSGQKVDYNKVVSIKFKSWTIEYPVGEMINSFCDLDPKKSIIELANSYKQSLLNHGGFYKIKRIKNLQNSTNSDLKEIFNNAICQCQNQQPFHKIRNPNDFLLMCNIDPPGCTDIDDVLSYQENINGKGEKIGIIGVHIVDVVYVLYLFSQHYPNFANEIYGNMFSNEVFFTVYPSLNKEKPYGIISDFLVEEFLTLKTNVSRYVWSTYFHINLETNEIIDTYICPEIIVNKQTYTYDEAETVLVSGTSKHMNWMAQFAKLQGYKHYLSVFNSYDNHELNSHYMVSLFMILTNHTVGKILSSDNNCIYRSTVTNTLTDTDKTDIIIFGKYNLNDKNNYHKSIGINNYTHFTSPIRRIIDQHVHLRLHNIFNLEIDDGFNSVFTVLNLINDEKINTINRSLSAMKIIGNQFKLLSLIKSENSENNVYNCKLLDYVYDNESNKLNLKWLINDEIKVYDMINNPFIEITNSDNIILRNRLSDSESICLVKGNNYQIKINLLLFNNMKNIKVVLSYFSDIKL